MSFEITGEDFTGQDLRMRRMDHQIYVRCVFDHAILPKDCSFTEFRQCSFKGTDCREVNFMHSVFPACVFEPEDCYGMTITITCKTFENLHVSQLWFYLWLMMAAAMRPAAEPVQADLRELLISFIGQDRYRKLQLLLVRRSY